MSKQYLDKRGLQLLCNSLKTLINEKNGFEYGSVFVGEGGATLYIGQIHYCKLILFSAMIDSAVDLKIQIRNDRGTFSPTLATLTKSQLKSGVEIELFSHYALLRDSNGKFINYIFRSDTTKIVFTFNTGSSSDELEFLYRMEN